MRKAIAGALLATTLGLGLATVTAPAPASAQGIVITPNGVRIFPGDRDYNRWGPRYRRNVDRDDAIYIARRHGIGRVYDVDRRGGRWVVTGDNRRGRGGLKITIDRSSGRVIDIDRRWHR
jgi:hypothetical protein